ncbi:hypothetical protein HYFRA_00007428 [Hymenoscyphus fraxineus]|uniref:Uncharacterized protein n=1 Tax=Hymenoscyphus fraxineus TaxID=746836 RepID=A0A9N9KT32_9HELO|nr:hypothetical protein HYFRA_00007428 [Hymenoscyphus fraxineus]
MCILQSPLQKCGSKHGVVTYPMTKPYSNIISFPVTICIAPGEFTSDQNCNVRVRISNERGRGYLNVNRFAHKFDFRFRQRYFILFSDYLSSYEFDISDLSRQKHNLCISDASRVSQSTYFILFISIRHSFGIQRSTVYYPDGNGRLRLHLSPWIIDRVLKLRWWRTLAMAEILSHKGQKGAPRGAIYLPSAGLQWTIVLASRDKQYGEGRWIMDGPS